MYTQHLQQLLTQRGSAADPRHIEGFIRLDYDALDGFTPEEWEREVTIGLRCLAEAGVAAAERNAQSFNL